MRKISLTTVKRWNDQTWTGVFTVVVVLEELSDIEGTVRERQEVQNSPGYLVYLKRYSEVVWDDWDSLVPRQITY